MREKKLNKILKASYQNQNEASNSLNQIGFKYDPELSTNESKVFVDKKGNIISTGYNKFLYVPKDKIKIFNKYNHVKISEHAEEVALKNADPKKLDGAKLYVVRSCLSDSNTLFMCSKPCHRCTSIINTCIEKCGLKIVYHT